MPAKRSMRAEISDKRISYQANGSNCLGKGKKHVYRRIEPFCPSLIGTLGLIQLLFKNNKNGIWRLAVLQLLGE